MQHHEQTANFRALELAREMVKEKRIKEATFTDDTVVPSVLRCRVTRWLVDTGAGRHVIGRKLLTNDQLANIQTVEPITFWTANCNFESSEAIMMYIDPLGIEVLVYILDQCLAALSAGRLCEEDGCKLDWAAGGKVALLHPPNGKPILLDVYARRPYLD